MPEENPREREETKEKGQSSKKSIFNLPFLIKWAGLVVAILVASYFVVEKVATPFLTPKVSKKEEMQPVSAQPKKEEIGPVYNFDPIIVNLNEEGARRYLKVTLSLELSSPEVTREIELLKPRLLDCLITLLSSKSLKDIEGAKGKENLRKQIVAEINRHLNTGIVINAYFGEFIIQ